MKNKLKNLIIPSIVILISFTALIATSGFETTDFNTYLFYRIANHTNMAVVTNPLNITINMGFFEGNSLNIKESDYTNTNNKISGNVRDIKFIINYSTNIITNVYPHLTTNIITIYLTNTYIDQNSDYITYMGTQLITNTYTNYTMYDKYSILNGSNVTSNFKYQTNVTNIIFTNVTSNENKIYYTNLFYEYVRNSKTIPVTHQNGSFDIQCDMEELAGIYSNSRIDFSVYATVDYHPKGENADKIVTSVSEFLNSDTYSNGLSSNYYLYYHK